jgi:hypothetical protein
MPLKLLLPMATQENNVRSARACGCFFGSLVALSAGLAFVNASNGQWGIALELVPGMIFFSGLAWWAFSSTPADLGPDPSQGAGESEAGVPVPVRPSPTHHLIAAKELPPSDKTHSFPRD